MLKIINGDSLEELKNLKESSVDVVLTSPPYNSSRRGNTPNSLKNNSSRYDLIVEERTSEEYANWVLEYFKLFNKVLKPNGVVIWNASYSSASSVAEFECVNSLWISLAKIIQQSNFMIADKIIWKKSSALPNNVSSNKLTRICEDIFVFCRKDEYKTFTANKEVNSISKKGQKYYKSVFNFIEAKNNDGSNPLNKATFSTELATKLLSMYAKPNSVVLDPFVGTGTTLNACKDLGLNGIGIELSKAQCEYAKNRLKI